MASSLKNKLRLFFKYKNGFLYYRKCNDLKKDSMVGRRAGTINKGYYWIRTSRISGVHQLYSLSRCVWVYHNGIIKNGMFVDHINGDTLDNRIENLRLATASQNCMNARGKINKKTSLPKNIYLDRAYNPPRYKISVTKNGISSVVWGVKNIKEAEKIASNMRKTLHGKFSNQG